MRKKMIDTTYVTRRWIDVQYIGGSEAQRLDIYLPEHGEGPFPVILSIHGGAFMKGDKMDHQLKPMLEGLNRGYAVVSVNYRLSGEAKFPAQIYDVKAAVRFIKENAKEYLLDKNKIVAWGGSAGGHLSAMLGTTGEGQLEDETITNKVETSDVQAVVDWFGPTDFLKMDEQLKACYLEPQDHNDEDSPESLLLGAKITVVPEKVREANPITYITKNVPPFFIQHGSKDNLVPHQQSVLLVNKLLEVCDKENIEFEIIPGAKHGSEEFTTNENVNKVFRFIDKHLK